MMADDPFQDLLELEDEFYKEGYDAGVSDSSYAGMIEGKVFGIEKGYEKALELAKLHGRAMVWHARISQSTEDSKATILSASGQQSTENDSALWKLSDIRAYVNDLPQSSRLQRHIENLLVLTDGSTMKPDNSDEAVAEFDDRLAKARAKAKIIANTAGESLNPVTRASTGIEDATGLNARH